MHKVSGELIRFNKLDIDDDLGIVYYFSSDTYLPIWVTSDKSKIEYLSQVISVSPYESIRYDTPSNEYVNLNDYCIIKFMLINN
jgi:hypothetical protein